MSADRAELEALSVAFRPALIRYFARRTGNHAEAEDLTQEVFIRLAGTDMPEVRSRDSYIFATASNLLRDRARRDRVRADYREDVQRMPELGLDPLDPHRVAEGHAMLRELHAGLAELPERMRRFFTLYRIENVPKKTIAAAFGVSESTVEKEVIKAMAILIDRLGRRS